MGRLRVINEGDEGQGPVVYWMSRDQRTADNWALVLAQEAAEKRGLPLRVAFTLVPEFLEATARQYRFMIDGLREAEESLRGKGIGFDLLIGDPGKSMPDYIGEEDPALLMTDFDPLTIKRRWREKVAKEVDVPIMEVDAHNVVPCWESSDKREYAAHTIRPKINSKLDSYLKEIPPLRAPSKEAEEADNRWEEALASLEVEDMGDSPMAPGEAEASGRLESFLKEGLKSYIEDRNDPNREGQSGLSPYLHFGHISAQRVALRVRDSQAPSEAREAFLEELVVRRELSDNFCFYEPGYDSVDAFPDWSKKTLDEHRGDAREYLYSSEELENGRTHDPLWNAAQMQMVKVGKMHGYMRMYWGKKILEWTESPERAMEEAVYLNDRYEMDGRDPNGYAGIAWSIGGVHDRAWKEREVTGKIRYMSFNGAKRKFDVQRFVERWADP